LCMVFSLILSTRWGFLESLFNGMDKLYKAHGVVGRWSLTLLVLHPIFLSLVQFPDFIGMLTWFLPRFGSIFEIGHFLGLIALIVFVILIYLTISAKIDYQLWKKSHAFFGFVFSLSIIHISFVNADIAKYNLFGLWFYFWLAFGMFAYLYTTLLYKYFSKKYEYVVNGKENISNVVELDLVPTSQKIKYNPGQFVYVDFHQNGLKGEWHPYSIANYREDGQIRLGIKALGDFSTKVQDIPVGTKVSLKGPYGFISRKLIENPQKEIVLLGGGIGITPMISIWDYIHQKNRKNSLLVYIVSFIEEASFDNDIKNVHNDNNEYWLYLDGKKDFFNINKLKERLTSLENKVFVICGPGKMMESMIKGLKENGVKNSDIIIEDFNFGIGTGKWFSHFKNLLKQNK
ncbi:MAG: ferredoxin reductase family protein, partial [Patescibacteria group bacterium]